MIKETTDKGANMTNRNYTRLDILKQMKQAGMKIYHNHAVSADYAHGESLPVSDLTLEYDWSALEKARKDGTAPFNMTYAEQEAWAKEQGGTIATAEEVLVMVLNYWKKHKKIPLNIWSYMRCRNVDSVGYRVRVGDFDSVGWDVGRALPEGSDGLLGVVVSPSKQSLDSRTLEQPRDTNGRFSSTWKTDPTAERLVALEKRIVELEKQVNEGGFHFTPNPDSRDVLNFIRQEIATMLDRVEKAIPDGGLSDQWILLQTMIQTIRQEYGIEVK